jgi:flagellar biosynthesis chaperone FliJ
MAVSHAMRRLLRIRDLEEEQRRLALESALGELNRLEHALGSTAGRERRGRHLVETSVDTGELLDRLGGLEETHAAARLAAALVPRIAAVKLDTIALRQQYLGKRVERRQAETLIQETEARDAIETNRRDQQALDDWYRSQSQRRGTGPESDVFAVSKPAALK